MWMFVGPEIPFVLIEEGFEPLSKLLRLLQHGEMPR